MKYTKPPIYEGMILVSNRAMPYPDLPDSALLLLRHSDTGGSIAVNLSGGPVVLDGWTEGVFCGGPAGGMAFDLRKGDSGDAPPSFLIGDTGYSYWPWAPTHPRNTFSRHIAYGYIGWQPRVLARMLRLNFWQATDASLDDLLAVPASQRYIMAGRSRKLIRFQ